MASGKTRHERTSSSRRVSLDSPEVSTEEHFARELMETQELVMAPGSFFQLPPGHFRLGFGALPEVFEPSFERLLRVLG